MRVRTGVVRMSTFVVGDRVTLFSRWPSEPLGPGTVSSINGSTAIVVLDKPDPHWGRSILRVHPGRLKHLEPEGD